MTITFFLNLFLHLFLATGVSAHGFVSQVSIAGKVYTGNLPGGTANPSIVRQVSDIGPVKGADNPDLFCGLGSKVASDVADANPGDTIGVKWVGGSTGQGNWIHNVGPMFTYMASCGDTPCNEYTSTDAKWFKIEQIARTSDGGPWAQAALTDPSTNVVNIQLPSTLAPGNYLFRHEVLSLQNGVAMGGAEFYPSCTQLKVGGSGTGGPENDELVSLPGAYHDDDPGIYDPNVYDPSAPYTFPGPPVAKFAADGSSSSGSSGSSGSSSSDSPASSSSADVTSPSTSSFPFVSPSIPNPNAEPLSTSTSFTPGGSSSGSSSNSGGSSGGSGSSVSNQGDSVLASQTCRLRKSEIDTTSLFSLQHVVQNRRHSKRRLASVMRSLLPNTWNPS